MTVIDPHPSFTTSPRLTDPLYPIIVSLRDLLDSYANHRVPESEQIVTIAAAGRETVVDDYCPGLAWVRVVRAFPSETFPFPSRTVTPCEVSAMAAQVELGIVRCGCIPDDNGIVDPTCLAEEAQQSTMDQMVLLQVASSVCRSLSLECSDVDVGDVAPLDTLGGYFGNVIDVTVAFDLCLDDLDAP